MLDSPIEEIKNRLDIVEVIQEYVRLRKAGANYKALCPFHNEKTPSLMVSSEKQIWHCFGCSEGGDIFGFIMRMEGIEFPEALRILAGKAGVELKRQDPALQNQKTRLLDVCKLAVSYYHKVLLESSSGQFAREYLKSRKVEADTIDQFKIGYAPEAWDLVFNFLHKKGYTEEEIFLAGLTVKKEIGIGYYDRFRCRLMFPINDVHGHVVGFGGRILKTDDPTAAKYINSPQTLIYNKSYILYGLDKAKTAIRKKNEVIVVEGYMDCVTAHQAGIINTVASSGTALTEGQIQLLKRFTNTIVMAFDQDTAGEEAAKRGIEAALSQEMNVKVVELMAGKDPDENIKEDKEGFLKAVGEAKTYLAYYFNNTFKKLDVSKVEDKKEAARILLPVIAKIGDSIEQTYWLKELGKYIDIELNILREKIQRKIVIKENETPASKLPSIKPIDRFQKIGEEILSLLLLYPEQIRSVVQDLLPEHFNDQKEGLLYKSVIVYYTENEKFDSKAFQQHLEVEKGKDNQELSSYLDILNLLGEEFFSDLDELTVKKNLKERILMLKKNYILSQLKIIEQKIKTLEKKPVIQKNQKELDLLTETFNQLTNQLNQL